MYHIIIISLKLTLITTIYYIFYKLILIITYYLSLIKQHTYTDYRVG